MLGETCSANTLFDMANPFGREWSGPTNVPWNPPPSRVESDYFMGSEASTPYLTAIVATVQPTAKIGIGA
jgi:hypothetical protein